MFFSSWEDIGRAVVVSSIVFFVIVAVMRVVGPQALAKMSPFDMVFTVMLGSVVATVAVTKGITIAEAVTAILTLLILQEIIRWAQSRFLKVHQHFGNRLCAADRFQRFDFVGAKNSDFAGPQAR